jgi:single-strand DNA-binding protein
MNYYVITGRLIKDPETRYTKDNKAVTTVNVAINNSKDDTTFLPITFFGKTAETVGKYTKKGNMIAVSGTIKNNNWEDKDGNKHYDYQFIGNNITFLSTKKGQETTIQGNEKQKKDEKLPNEVFQEFSEIIEETDIPFEV